LYDNSTRPLTEICIDLKRMQKSSCVIILALFFPLLGLAQQLDSAFTKELEEVVVTATRNERKLGNVAVPVTIINQKKIQQAGSLRLRDILQEQTGLFLTSGFGTGVQMQGLSPDYTLILIDGEPIVGRTAGILDLNRLTVGNIKKIEIVKGPSSSLYGSEALAGVINIITDRSFNNKLDATVRFGTYNTWDLNLAGSTRAGKLGVNAFINSYSTDGYSIRPSSVERSKLPVWRLTPQVQLSYPLSKKTQLNISTRYNYEYIKNELAISNNGQITYSSGREKNKDLNITPTITHQFNQKLKTSLRLYGTLFEGSQQLLTQTGNGYDDFFRQQFYRIENQTDYTLSGKFSVIGGVGTIAEYVNSTRYDSKSNRKDNNIKYAFTQAEWKPTPKWTLIGGLRYDDNRLYASALSPKIALQFKANERFRLQASFGRGFKAPDFRQLYLNFTNTAAGGYSVYGAIDARRNIDRGIQLGVIDPSFLTSDYNKLKQLSPEFSSGWNIGFTSYPLKNLNWQVNLFRNDIENLIENRLVVTAPQIYSYINIKKAYTQGVETNIQYQLNKEFSIAGGYQLLLTADKDELRILKRGDTYYTKDANNISRLLKRNEYVGLPNRSKHMGNLKLNYEKNPAAFFATARAIYRNQWVVFNADGNEVFNKQDEFADGFIQLNISAGKTFKNRLRWQAGIDNILNYTDEKNLPNQPGRTFYTAIAYSFVRKNQSKNNK
jgi:outer membrane receptor for ferrienterochelin and colicins